MAAFFPHDKAGEMLAMYESGKSLLRKSVSGLCINDWLDAKGVAE